MTREEALKKAISIVSYFEAHFAKSKEAREDAVNIIEVLEQEPKTGHWIRGKYKDTCNKCRCTYPINIGFKNFCPNCGAKMD